MPKMLGPAMLPSTVSQNSFDLCEFLDGTECVTGSHPTFREAAIALLDTIAQRRSLDQGLSIWQAPHGIVALWNSRTGLIAVPPRRRTLLS
jgi:hypothetical protein